MLVCIDLSGRIVRYSYNNLNNIKSTYLDSIQNFNISTMLAKDSFPNFCSMVLSEIKKQRRFDIEEVLCVVPSHIGYHEKRQIMESFQNNGVLCKRVLDSNDASAIQLYYSFGFGKKQVIICNLMPEYLELSFYELGDRVIECLGTSSLTFKGPAYEYDREKLIRILEPEIKQLKRDILFGYDDIEEWQVFFIEDNSQKKMKDTALEILSKVFGKDVNIMMYQNFASVGGFRQLLKLHGEGDEEESFLLLATVNKGISAAMGKHGEHKFVVNYYSAIPTKAKQDLIVSTENTLYIYEGNYKNPKYDTLLMEIEIPESLEGKIINVEIDIDGGGEMSFRVYDNNKKSIIQRTLL